MKILVQLSDEVYNGFNFPDAKSGNFGLGGTTYQQLLLAQTLIEKGHSVELLHFSDVTFQNDFKCLKYSSNMIIDQQYDFAILTHSNILHDLINASRNTKVIFFWAHIQLNPLELKLLETSRIKKVVFAGYETAMWFYDSNIHNKLDYIYASLSDDLFSLNLAKSSNGFKVDPNKFNICFMGSITKAKGFHIVTKNWKAILKKIPNAHLHVIGSGKLYNRNSELGPMNLASKEYERLIFKPLRKYPDLIKKITFHGVLGIEKYSLIRQMSLAIVNPLATSEVCSVTALEFSLMGVPIVSKRRYGMLDTVINGLNGYTFRFNYNFLKTLLRTRKESLMIGINESQIKSWLLQDFSSNSNSDKWLNLYERADINQNLELYHPFDNFKLFRLINYNLRKLFYFIPPTIWYYYILIALKKKIRVTISLFCWSK